MPNEICAVVGGKGFEQMAKGYFDSGIFAAGVGRGLLSTCTPSRFCREDYICQEMPDFVTGARFNVSAQALNSLRSRRSGFVRRPISSISFASMVIPIQDDVDL